MDTATQEAAAQARQPWPLNRGKRHASWTPALPPKPLQAQTIFDEALADHLAGRMAEAVTGYERAILLNPNHAEAHNNLATALLALGRTQDAVERFCQALSLQPDYSDALNNLAVALIAQGRIADGVLCYERVIALNPGRADIH